MLKRLSYYRFKARTAFYSDLYGNVLYFLVHYFAFVGLSAFFGIIYDVVSLYADTDFLICFGIIEVALYVLIGVPAFYGYSIACCRHYCGERFEYFKVFSDRDLYIESFVRILAFFKIYKYVLKEQNRKFYRVNILECILLFITYLPLILISYFTFGVSLVFGLNMYIYSIAELNRYYLLKSASAPVCFESFETAEDL